jgi:cytochrome oxidase Cu insertion factor (SCO1/SenC/PrrC family)
MWIIGVMILIVAFVFAGIVSTNQDNRDKAEGVILRTMDSGQYLGGFDDVEGGKKIQCTLYKDKLNIYFVSKYSKNISVSNINNIKIKSDIQMQNDVTLGRLLTVGVLAFGMKKKKTIVNNYVVLNYDNNGKDENIILQTDKNEDIVREINKLI